jgi:outer membrane protein assembly factor BamB
MPRLQLITWLGLLLLATALGVPVPQGAVAEDKAPSSDAPSGKLTEKTTGDWPLFRGNPLQTGVASTELPAQLKLRWKFRAQDGVEATAAIVGDTVYVPSLDQHLYALDLPTGKKKWSYEAGPFKAPISVAGDSVYLGDADGTFHCLDTSGAKRWTFKAGDEVTSGADFSGDDLLFGSGDGILHCLSKLGKERWQFAIQGGPVLGSPAVVGERTFASGCDSKLHVIETAKGQELSSVELSGQVGASVALAGDNLYVGTMTNQVLAVDWKKGQVAWTFEPEKAGQPFYASVAVTDALVIAGSRDRNVYALDRKTGKEVWHFRTGRQVDSSPVVAGQRVYVGSADGKLYVLDLAKGTEVQRFDLGGQVLASPAVGGRCLVIGTTKGDVYCFE